VSGRELRIPHRGLDQPVLGAIDDTRRALEGEDRALARGVLTERLFAGDETVGEVIAHLESLSSEERRAIADRAREAAGLVSFTEQARNLERARALRWPPSPPPAKPEEPKIQRCHAPGCGEVSSTAMQGPTPTAARKWFCPAHRTAKAGYQPGDLDPAKPSVRVDRLGCPLPPPHEEKFYGALYARMDREFKQREAQRTAERERIAKLEAEHRAKLPGPPAGFRPPNYGDG
jgi:hypothetical protein